MPEQDTTIIERAKATAQRHPKKTAGAVSLATLAIVYQIFVTQAVFKAHQDKVAEDIARNWSGLKDLENKVDDVRMQLIRLESRAVLTVKTNTP